MNLLAIFLGVLPGLIWLFFYLQEDIHPEPKRLILTAFIVGGLMAVPVIIFQVLTDDILVFLKLKNTIISIAALALIEEIFKFIAAYWTINKNPAFDEPIDAMIYLITAALGFATIENILIMGNIFYLRDAAFLTTAFSTTALRFIGATLLHALASGLLGYYWAVGLIKKSLGKNLSCGFFIAVLVHSTFNYLVLQFKSTNFLYPSLFLVLAAILALVDFEKLRKMV
jgi:RsiW-degrading membrane proteinase PrsW (M82 family)